MWISQLVLEPLSLQPDPLGEFMQLLYALIAYQMNAVSEDRQFLPLADRMMAQHISTKINININVGQLLSTASRIIVHSEIQNRL